MTSGGEGFFFANQGTLTIAGTGGTPAATAVNAIQNVKIEDTFSFATIYGWGSVRRQAVARYEEKVPVTIEWVKWDPTVATWIGAYVLNAAAGGTVADTNVVPTFIIKALFTSSTGVIMDIEVDGVYFKSLPIDGKLNEWMHVNLEGEGTTIIITNT